MTQEEMNVTLILSVALNPTESALHPEASRRSSVIHWESVALDNEVDCRDPWRVPGARTVAGSWDPSVN